MTNPARLLLLCGVASLAAGCQGSPLKGWSFGKSRAPARLAAVQVEGAAALEEGRALLRDGRLSAAAASFRIAMLDPATAADANNGLAVAYAKVGRPDLAERYFRAAIRIDPEDMRYTANLLRMQHGVMLARQAAEKRQQAALAAPAPAEPERLAASQRVHRATRGTFHIRTRGTPAAAPRMAVAYRTPAPKPEEMQGEKREQPPVELAVAQAPKAREILMPRHPGR